MNKYSSIFGQILQIFPKTEFYRAVMKTGAEKFAKGFIRLRRTHSLREICGGLASCFGKLKHLGLDSAPNRSTLSYANEHRSWQLYQEIFYQLLDRCQALTRGKKRFRFKNKLFSLDATIIELCASLFNWAKFRQTKGAVKLHLLLDHEGYLPVFAHITDGKVHEVNIARGLPA